ncbi:MAG TPA: glycogen-binding domain-containing protein [Gemmatimonadaceae bacterium]|nr:glycogen-binding domain-containing protein [Gemmatimonadaceae bacterium]
MRTSTVWGKCALGALAVVLGASALPGQVFGAADVSGVLGRSGGGPWRRASWVSPTILAQHRGGYVHAMGLLVEETGRVTLPTASLDAALSSRTFGVFRVTAFGQYARDTTVSAVAASTLNVNGAVSARFGRSGVWLGGGRARGGDAHPTPSLRLLAGAWRMLGGAVVSVAMQDNQQRFMTRQMTARQVTYVDSTYTDTAGWHRYTVDRTVVDTTSIRRLRRWTDIEARVDWSLGRTALGTALSARPSLDSTRAALGGHVDASVQLTPRLAFIAGVGVTPGRYATPLASRFATVGLRVTSVALIRRAPAAPVRPAATAFRAEQVSPDTWRITLRAPGARTVEVSGDFNQWSPVSLRETTPDLWEVTLPLPRGTHRISVRINGDSWDAPPGLPSVEDEFNGKVGLIVIR